MRVLTAVFAVIFVLKETEAWGYKNGILHNSIWLGIYFSFLTVDPNCVSDMTCQYFKSWVSYLLSCFPLINYIMILKSKIFNLLFNRVYMF